MILETGIEVEVSFNEVDSLQIVWHGHYLKYFEKGREAFGKRYEIGYLNFFQQGFLVPLIKAEVSFHKMVAYGEILQVKTSYVPVRSTKLIFKYEILNERNELVCMGKTVQVITDQSRKLVMVKPTLLRSFEERNKIKTW